MKTLLDGSTFQNSSIPIVMRALRKVAQFTEEEKEEEEEEDCHETLA